MKTRLASSSSALLRSGADQLPLDDALMPQRRHWLFGWQIPCASGLVPLRTSETEYITTSHTLARSDHQATIRDTPRLAARLLSSTSILHIITPQNRPDHHISPRRLSLWSVIRKTTNQKARSTPTTLATLLEHNATTNLPPMTQNQDLIKPRHSKPPAGTSTTVIVSAVQESVFSILGCSANCQWAPNTLG